MLLRYSGVKSIVFIIYPPKEAIKDKDYLTTSPKALVEDLIRG